MYESLFSQQGLSLDRLRALVEVASTGSISKAVDADPVRQSLYSRQIKELEEFFGVELTRRKGRGLVVTEKGQTLARIAREQFQGLSDFKQSCNNQELMFNIGAGDSLLHWLLIPVIGTIQEQSPNSRFSLHNRRSTDIIDGLTTLELDFGLVRPETVVRPIQSVIIGEISFSLFIPRKMIPRGKKPMDIISHLPIATQATDSVFKANLVECAAKNDIELDLRLYCESFPEARQALLSRQYAAILPDMADEGLIKKHYVKTNPPFLKNLKRNIAFVWNPRMVRLRSGAEALLETLIQSLSTHLAE